jgi:SUKH-3 immunity protein
VVSKRFSPATITVLEASGWRPGRSIDINVWVRALKSDGYDAFPSVAEFLREFGGLKLVFPHAKVAGVEDDCQFDPALAAADVSPERVSYWAGGIDERLCVVGEAHRRNMTLVMGISGKVFAGRDELLLAIGDDGEDAIEALCTGRPPVEVMT